MGLFILSSKNKPVTVPGWLVALCPPPSLRSGDGGAVYFRTLLWSAWGGLARYDWESAAERIPMQWPWGAMERFSPRRTT